MTIKALGRAWRFFKPTLIVFIFCYILLHYTELKISKINDNDFMFTFLGLVLGFSLTIFALIFSVIDRIKQEIKDNKKETEEIFKNIRLLYFEIKDDIMYNFVSLVVIAALYLIENTASPIKLSHQIPIITKGTLLQAIRLTLFLLNIYAVYDLMATAFRLSETTGIFKE